MHFASLIGNLEVAFPAVWAWFSAAWESIAKTTGTTLITAIWQGAVIVCGLEIAMRLMSRVAAAHRFAVWSAGFGVAAGLPLLPMMLHFAATGTAGSMARGAAGSTSAMWQLDARWGLAIAGLWVAASVIRGADLAVHSIRLRRLWKAARPVEVNESLEAALRSVRGGRVRICTTEMLDRPSVIGFFAPRILIPAWLMARLTPGELEQIVLHEAEHLRRRDDWSNLLQKLMLVVFPLNPALAWIEHQLCREREMACDEGVVRITNSPRAYAACLTSLAERGLERRAEALSLGAWHRRSELVHRVHGILLRKRGLSRVAAAALLGTVGCAMLAGSVEMARCPQLVEFVPAQKNLAMTPARQQELTAMLAREEAESKMALPPGYHVKKAKALTPENRDSGLSHVAKRESRPCAARPRVKDVSATRAQQIAKADVAGDRVNAGAEQRWVVLAAWEEVQTVSRTDGPTSDAVSDYGADDVTSDGVSSTEPQKISKMAGHGPMKGRSQPNNTYTVTQLILRVVPANTDSSQAAFVHGRWLVIQL